MSILETKIDEKVAQLQTELDSAILPKERIEALHRIAWELKLNDPGRARTYAQEVIQLAESLDEGEIQTARARNTVGITWHVEGNLEEALASYEEALNLYSDLDAVKEKANVFNNIGIAHEASGQYQKALEFYFRSLEIHDQIEDSDIVNRGNTLNNIGMIYYYQGNRSRALEYLLDAMAIFEEADFQNHVGNILVNLSSIYIDQGEHEPALETLSKAGKIKEKTGDNYGLFEVRYNMARIHEKNEKYSEALEIQQNMLEISQKINNKHGRCRVYANMGVLHGKLSHPNDSIEYLLKTFDIATEQQYTDLIGEVLYRLADMLMDQKVTFKKKFLGKNSLKKYKKITDILNHACELAETLGNASRRKAIYAALARLYGKEKEFEKAFHWQNKLVELKDELFDQDKTETIARLQVQFETEIMEKEIEKQKEVNRQLTELNDQIQDKNHEITLSAAKLRDANAQLKNFAQVASHDLKEPLRMIHSFGQLLTRRNRADMDDDSKEYLDYILDASKRMTVLIDDLLSYADLTNFHSEAEIIDLEVVLDSVRDNLRLAFEITGATLQTDPLPKVAGHASMYTQLFQNLVANAIKFRKEGVVPHIRIDCSQQGAFWHFALKDNGIGIEEAYFDRIFGIFSRLHARDEYEGSGIGLATCKKIVSEYGGEIDVDSLPGDGTTFYFTLPSELQPDKE